MVNGAFFGMRRDAANSEKMLQEIAE